MQCNLFSSMVPHILLEAGAISSTGILRTERLFLACKNGWIGTLPLLGRLGIEQFLKSTAGKEFRTQNGVCPMPYPNSDDATCVSELSAFALRY